MKSLRFTRLLKNTVYLFMVFGFNACTDNKPHVRKIIVKAVKPRHENKSAARIPKPVLVTSKDQIIGFWKSENKEELTVNISKDSIYYAEHFESHKYYLRNDSIYIKYYDFVFTGKPVLAGDSLLIYSEGGIAKYVRQDK